MIVGSDRRAPPGLRGYGAVDRGRAGDGERSTNAIGHQLGAGRHGHPASQLRSAGRYGERPGADVERVAAGVFSTEGLSETTIVGLPAAWSPHSDRVRASGRCSSCAGRSN